MIREATLTWPHAPLREFTAAGLTILERQLLTLYRAGIRVVHVDAAFAPEAVARARTEKMPGDLQIRWKSSPAQPARTRAPHLVVSGNHLIRPKVVSALVDGTRLHPQTLAYTDEARREVMRLVIDSQEALTGASPPPRRLTDEHCLFLPPSRHPREALTWLLRDAGKSGDGWMAKYFDRNISLRITRRLLQTPLKPNHMTLVSTGIGLLGTLQFLGTTHTSEVLGASLVWLHTVLDGCDGEMARLTFQESRWGRFLDFWGDNVVHVALFACLSLDFSHEAPLAVWAGALACAGTVASAGYAYWLSSSRADARGETAAFDPTEIVPDKNGKIGWLGRLEILLARRDFIYLLVLATAIDLPLWFLYAAGVGAPVYFFLLLLLHRTTALGEPAAGQPSSRAQESRPVTSSRPISIRAKAP